jgi:hypothetical protein
MREKLVTEVFSAELAVPQNLRDRSLTRGAANLAGP